MNVITAANLFKLQTNLTDRDQQRPWIQGTNLKAFKSHLSTLFPKDETKTDVRAGRLSSSRHAFFFWPYMVSCKAFVTVHFWKATITVPPLYLVMVSTKSTEQIKKGIFTNETIQLLPFTSPVFISSALINLSLFGKERLNWEQIH